MDRLRPWPSRAERRAAIENARAQRKRATAQRQTAEAGAAHAAIVRAEIERLAAENHFAARIAEGLIRRHAQGN